MSLAVIITKAGWKSISKTIRLEDYQRLKVDYMVSLARESGLVGIIINL